MENIFQKSYYSFFQRLKKFTAKKKNLCQLSDLCFLTYPNSIQQLRDRLLFWNVNSIDEKDKEQVNYDPKIKAMISESTGY